MTSSEYINTIKWTLSTHTTITEDVLSTARRIFRNLGVAFPSGSLADAIRVLSSGNYMGWNICSAEQARYCANNGYTAIGISNDSIVIILPENDAVSVDTAESDIVHTVISKLSDMTEGRIRTMQFFANASILEATPINTESSAMMSIARANITCEGCDSCQGCNSCQHCDSCQTCNSCQDTCETSCQSSCQFSCQSSCQSSCQTCNSCQAMCETSCQHCNTCETCNSCQATCESICQDACESTCQKDNQDSSTYTVTYNLNGGIGQTPQSQSFTLGDRVTLAALDHPRHCCKLDHTFDGWSTSPNGSGTLYHQGESVNFASNTVLYAQFTNVSDN